MKENDGRMNVAKFHAFHCNYFYLYAVLGNNTGWLHDVRNVVSLYFVDLNLLALENNGH